MIQYRLVGFLLNPVSWVVGGVLAFVALTATVIVHDAKAFAEHQQQMRLDWDAGQGRPASARVVAGGPEVKVPESITEDNYSRYWALCRRGYCPRDLQHYPTVYDSAYLRTVNDYLRACYCLDFTLDGVREINVATPEGYSGYTAVLSDDTTTGRTRLLICYRVSRGRTPFIIWSDDPKAAKPAP